MISALHHDKSVSDDAIPLGGTNTYKLMVAGVKNASLFSFGSPTRGLQLDGTSGLGAMQPPLCAVIRVPPA
jgi:hypothetical protein